MIRLSVGTSFDPETAVEIHPTIFPDKTSQVWKLPDEAVQKIRENGAAAIRWDFESEAELLHLAQLAALLKTSDLHVNLDLPYLPYARQDKDVSNETTFALHAFAKLLNTLELNEIRVLDAHSGKAEVLIKGLKSFAPREDIRNVLLKVAADLILFPDAGAKTRYDAYRLAKCVYAEKDRDQSTGLIKGIAIHGAVKDKTLLIVDDICDGGMTFKLTAEQALKDGAKEVHLFVTHGIFSKGVETLRQSGIRRIFTHLGEVPKETK